MESTLPRDAYVGTDWFDSERQHVFEDQWFSVGRGKDTGFYAPMEDYSMDIRRYLNGLM